MKAETKLQISIANYLAQNYPDIQFHSDFGSGADLSKKQADLQSQQNARRRGWPDMTIAEPKRLYIKPRVKTTFGKYKPKERDSFWRIYEFAGLYLELKKDGERLYSGPRSHPCNHFRSKDGKEYRTQHFQEQADVLYDLRSSGYCAEFAVGYDEAIRIITEYLGDPPEQKIEF